ncbi:hypothetical protein [Amycolatopsis anabasis]|uniref:hypothetical protein n=1 Tax=Amycolatopsis anabasis TaxID=1840409 RepID=UPI00131E73BF|nr:hypothetical protein [Amycolatopsis anabasis]
MGFFRKAFVAALAVCALGSVTASAAGGKWTQLADQTYDESVAAVARADTSGRYVRAQFVASLAWYAGQKVGWQDQRTRDWLDRLYGLRTPTTAYGLGAAYDAYGDGTTNPATTAYTITGAWHVGWTLIAGYDGGGVPADRMREIAGWLDRIPLAAGGKCAAYSEHRYDAGKPCVWNVSAAGAWFLWQAQKRGLIADTVLAKVRAWRDHVRGHFDAGSGAWTYQAGSSGRQDVWHNAATVAAMNELDPSIGKPALAGHFRNWPASGANAGLLPYDCAKAEANYAAIKASATKPVTDPIEILQSRAGYAPALLRIARVCGDQ